MPEPNSIASGRNAAPGRQDAAEVAYFEALGLRPDGTILETMGATRSFPCSDNEKNVDLLKQLICLQAKTREESHAKFDTISKQIEGLGRLLPNTWGGTPPSPKAAYEVVDDDPKKPKTAITVGSVDEPDADVREILVRGALHHQLHTQTTQFLEEVEARVKQLESSEQPVVHVSTFSEGSHCFDAGLSRKKHKLALDCDYHEVDPNLNTDLVNGDNIGAIFTSLFGTASDLDILSKEYKVETLYKDYGCAQAIARSEEFSKFCSTVVLLNALYLPVEPLLELPSNIYEQQWPYQVTSQIFCVFFVFELLIRFLAFQRRCDCLRDGWFRLDLFLAVLMVVDYWISMPIVYLSANTKMDKLPGQHLRLLRLLKLSRLTHLLKYFPELLTMVRSTIRGLRSIASAMGLILFLMYLFGTLLHYLMKTEDELNDQFMDSIGYRFTKLTDVCFLLFTAGVLQLDGLGLLLSHLFYSNELNPFISGIIFLIFTLITNVLIMQMVIALLCDIVSNVNAEQKEIHTLGLAKHYLLGHLMAYCREGEEAKLGRAELIEVMLAPEPKALLKKLKINRSFFCEIASLLYVKPDTKVPIHILLELLSQCRGDNSANVDIVASAFTFLNQELADMEHRIISKCFASSKGYLGMNGA